jgi:RNA polymerase sigma-70 factor (ECF subfamily)
MESTVDPGKQGRELLEDASLAAAAAGGDGGALATLAERYRRYIYVIAYKIVLNEEDALDITQNVLMRLVQKIGSYRGAGAFRSWLGAIAAREALDHRRGGRRETALDPAVLETLTDGRMSSRERNPRELLETARRLSLVEEALAGVSAQQRAIFVLRLREDLKPREIAVELGIPAQQVRSQLCRALAKVKEAVKEREQEGVCHE